MTPRTTNWCQCLWTTYTHPPPQQVIHCNALLYTLLYCAFHSFIFLSYSSLYLPIDLPLPTLHPSPPPFLSLALSLPSLLPPSLPSSPFFTSYPLSLPPFLPRFPSSSLPPFLPAHPPSLPLTLPLTLPHPLLITSPCLSSHQLPPSQSAVLYGKT